MSVPAIVLIMIAASSGPVSKFNDNKPSLTTTSTASIFEVERCLIDLPGKKAPIVYRQPDQPDRATMLWIDGLNGNATDRVDLLKAGGGTQVTAWMHGDGYLKCIRPSE